MADKARYEIAVGMVFFAAIAILGYYTIIMSKKIMEPDNKYPISVIFKNIEGLQAANKVKVNGVVAGSVEDIQLMDYLVLVKLKIYKEFSLYENYKIRIKNEAAFGGKYVSINPGFPMDDKGRKFAAVHNRENLHGELEDPFNSISALIDENKENINVSIRNLREISEKINSGQGTIGKLFNQDEVYTQTNDLMKDLKEAVEDAREQAPITSFIRAALSAF